MSEEITLDIDATPAYNTLAAVEEARQNAQQGINMTLSMARSAYMGIVSIVRIGGGTVSSLFSSIISMGISAVSFLYPILTTQAVTGDYVRAGLGLLNLGIATAALVAASAQQQQLANQLHSANALMHSVQMFIGQIPSLWK